MRKSEMAKTEHDIPEAGEIVGPAEAGAVPPEAATIQNASPNRLALERFRKDRLSMVSFWVIVLFLLLAISGPILVKLGVLHPNDFHQDLLGPTTMPNGHLGGVSWKHPFGVEPGTGRDVMSRIWLGLTLSMVIATTATLLAVVVGVVAGIVAGFTGGWVDAIIGRIIDLTLSFPQTLMLLAMSAFMVELLHDKLHIPEGDPAQAVFVIFVLSAFGWPSIARLIRGQVLSLREREFVAAAIVLGASRRRMWFKEVLPNLWAPIIVNFTLTLPLYVSTEAALGFLGVTIKPPTPTLGNVLGDTLNYADIDFFYFLMPGATIAILVICFNLLGDGLRDALDPKTNR